MKHTFFEPISDGTRLTFTLEAPLAGIWTLAAPAVRLLLALVMRGAVDELARLRRLLESEKSENDSHLHRHAYQPAH